MLYQLSYSRNVWGWLDSNQLSRSTGFTVQPASPTAAHPPVYFALMHQRADGRTRTADQLITNQLLYQLSYIGLTRIIKNDSK